MNSYNQNSINKRGSVPKFRIKLQINDLDESYSFVQNTSISPQDSPTGCQSESLNYDNSPRKKSPSTLEFTKNQIINLGGINPTRSRSNCKRDKEETSNALEISQINKHLAKAGISNIGENMTKSPRMNADVKKSNTILSRRSKFTKIM